MPRPGNIFKSLVFCIKNSCLRQIESGAVVLAKNKLCSRVEPGARKDAQCRSDLGVFGVVFYGANGIASGCRVSEVVHGFASRWGAKFTAQPPG